MSLKEGYKKTSKIVFKAPVREKKSVVVNGIDLLENVPPRTENEVPGTWGWEGTVPGWGDILWVQLGTLPPCRALPVFPKSRTWCFAAAASIPLHINHRASERSSVKL